VIPQGKASALMRSFRPAARRRCMKLHKAPWKAGREWAWARWGPKIRRRLAAAEPGSEG